MVRPKNQRIWAHYRKTENKSAICKYCEKRYKIANSEKMLRHLLKCLNCPENYKQEMRSYSTQRVNSSRSVKMERPKSLRIWTHYRETENKSAICKYCEKRYKIANSQKMLTHLLECLNCPENTKEEIMSSRSDKIGRPKNQRVWAHYRETENKAAICKYCEKRYKIANLEKMLRHLPKCLNCPENCKQEMRSYALQRVNSSRSETGCELKPSVENEITMNAESELSSPIRISFTSYEVARVSEEDQQKLHNLHSLLAKAIYVSGTPPSIVEHPLWISFFDQLQPRYKLPTIKSLSGSLLEKTYKEIYRELEEEIMSQQCLHLQLDGWSDCRNDGIINILITKPEPAFIKSIVTGENRHTGENISEEILKTMSEYGAKKFLTLIGDNSTNIQRAFRLIKEKYPHVSYLNCTAHTLHLLCKNILKIPIISYFIDLAIHVINAIKKSQKLTSLLEIIMQEKGGETLKLPCDTHWSSYCKSFISVEKSKIALQALAVHEKAIPLLSTEHKSALLDDFFWQMIRECILILQPMSDAILKLESNEHNIHKVFLTLKNMKSTLLFCLPEITIIEEATKNEILVHVDERIDMCLKPIHFAADMLDPTSQGMELNENQELTAVEYICEVGRNAGVNVMPNLASYRARDNYWRRKFLWENIDDISPVNWWKGICASTTLSKVAVRILTAPCISAATERTSRSYSNIHSKKLNKPYTDRAAKIKFISYNWCLMHKREKDGTTDFDDYKCGTSPVYQVTNEPSTSPKSSRSPQPSTSGIPDVEFLDWNNLTDSSDDEHLLVVEPSCI